MRQLAIFLRGAGRRLLTCLVVGCGTGDVYGGFGGVVRCVVGLLGGVVGWCCVLSSIICYQVPSVIRSRQLSSLVL